MAYDLGATGAAVFLDDSPYMTTLNGLPGRTASVMARVQQTFMRTLGYYGAYRLFKNAASAAMDFGAEISNVASIATEFTTRRMREQVLALNSVLGRSIDLAQGVYYAYSGGVRGTEQQLASFAASQAKTAKAIRAELIPTVRTAASVMNAYNMTVKDADKLGDWMYSIVKYGQTTGTELSNSLGLIIDSAATAGISLESLGAAIATLTRTQPTSRALTSLNQVLMSFIDPSKDAKEWAEKLGIEFSLTALRSKGLAGAMKDISDKAGDNVEALNAMFGNVRAFRAAAALAGSQAQTFQSILKEFGDNSGSMLEAFNVQTDNLKTTWQTSMVDMGKAAIKFGDSIAPLVSITAKLISTGADAVSFLSDHKVLLIASSAAVAVLGYKTMSYIAQLVQIPGHLTAINAGITSQTVAINAQTAAYAANTAAVNGNNIAKANNAGGAMFNRGTNPMMSASNAAFDKDIGKIQTASKVESSMMNARHGQVQAGNTLFRYKEQTAAYRRALALEKLYIKNTAAATASTSKFAAAVGNKLSVFHAGMKGITALGTAVNYLGGAFAAVGTAVAGYKIGEAIGKYLEMEDRLYDLVYSGRKINSRSSDLDNKLADYQVKRADQLTARLKALVKENKITSEQFEKALKDIKSGDTKRLLESGTFVNQAENGKLPQQQKKKSTEAMTDIMAYWREDEQRAIINEAKRRHLGLEALEQTHQAKLAALRTKYLLSGGQIDRKENRALIDAKLAMHKKMLDKIQHQLRTYTEIGNKEAISMFQEKLNKETAAYASALEQRRTLDEHDKAERERKEAQRKAAVDKLNKLRTGFTAQQEILDADNRPGKAYSQQTMRKFAKTLSPDELKDLRRRLAIAEGNAQDMIANATGRINGQKIHDPQGNANIRDRYKQSAFAQFIREMKQKQSKLDELEKESNTILSQIKKAVEEIKQVNAWTPN